MPDTYQINVTNNNSDPTRYLLFCTVPKASDNIGTAYTNIWAATPGVAPNGGNTTINITSETYAVCGMAPQKLGPGVDISTSVAVPISLGPGKLGQVSADIVSGGLMFEGDPQKTTVEGGYQIDTGAWNNAQYPNAFCGMGKMQPFSSPTKIIPVATWTAKSSNHYKVYPKVVYYISTGDYKPGEIVDVANFGAIATVDFSGKKQTVANVTQLDDGTYGPVQYIFPV